MNLNYEMPRYLFGGNLSFGPNWLYISGRQHLSEVSDKMIYYILNYQEYKENGKYYSISASILRLNANEWKRRYPENSNQKGWARWAKSLHKRVYAGEWD